jgi:hypothetical protein
VGHNLWGHKESDRTEHEHEQEKGKMNYFPNFQESEALSFIKAGIKKKIPHYITYLTFSFEFQELRGMVAS